MGEKLENQQTDTSELEKSARLSRLILEMNLSQRAFAVKAGISPTSISQVLTGVRRLTAKMVWEINKSFPNVNSAWLMNGEGQMFLPPGITVPTVAEQGAPYRTEQEFRDLLDRIEALSRDLEREKKINSELSESILNLTKPK